MTGRTGRQNPLTSPVMVGATTVLIAIVAVFLAYNANAGLPFVPTYQLNFELPNAANLVPGNDVRINGVRVGRIADIEPISGEDGRTSARFTAELDESVRELPRDSTVIVRSLSALGLKYLQVTKGTSDQGIPEGGVVPLSQARPEPVEIDQVLNTFNTETRDAIKVNLQGFGTGFAGRGADLNRALEDLPSLLRNLEPLAGDLADPDTDLAGFVRGLGAAAAEVAPVADTQAELFVNLDITFTALSEVARPFIQETIAQSPPTLDAAVATLPRIRPFLRNSEDLFRDLRPVAASLRRVAPDLDDATRIGTTALRGSPAFNARLIPTFEAVEQFSTDPVVIRGIDRLIETVELTEAPLAFITPAQTVCNYASLLLRNAADHLSVGDGVGTWQRFITVLPKTDVPNSEALPSSAPANGPNPLGFLHSNPYPNTAAPGQPRECEAGNEPYTEGKQQIGNVPGNQGTVTEDQTDEQKEEAKQPAPAPEGPAAESSGGARR